MEECHRRAGRVIQNAWQNKDIESLRSLLAATDLKWYEGAFDQPLMTSGTVIKQWDKDLAKQTDTQVEINLLDWVENRSYHHCTASWQDETGLHHQVDALFAIGLDLRGKLNYFMPWYTTKP